MTEVETKKQKMYYRMLGNTGLQVSVLAYGFWATFGAKEDLTDQEGIQMGNSNYTAPLFIALLQLDS